MHVPRDVFADAAILHSDFEFRCLCQEQFALTSLESFASNLAAKTYPSKKARIASILLSPLKVAGFTTTPRTPVVAMSQAEIWVMDILNISLA